MGLSSLVGPDSTPERSPGRQERLGQSVGRASDTGEGAAGNPATESAVLSPCSLAVIDLSDLKVWSCLAQTSKCKTDLRKVIDVVSGLA